MLLSPLWAANGYMYQDSYKHICYQPHLIQLVEDFITNEYITGPIWAANEIRTCMYGDHAGVHKHAHIQYMHVLEHACTHTHTHTHTHVLEIIGIPPPVWVGPWCSQMSLGNHQGLKGIQQIIGIPSPVWVGPW